MYEDNDDTTTVAGKENTFAPTAAPAQTREQLEAKLMPLYRDAIKSSINVLEKVIGENRSLTPK